MSVPRRLLRVFLALVLATSGALAPVAKAHAMHAMHGHAAHAHHAHHAHHAGDAAHGDCPRDCCRGGPCVCGGPVPAIVAPLLLVSHDAAPIARSSRAATAPPAPPGERMLRPPIA